MSSLRRGLFGPYSKLLKKWTIFEESDRHQYRFKDSPILKPRDHVHHRARGAQHAQYAFHCGRWSIAIRRKATSNYAQGYEAWNPGMTAQNE